MRRCVCVLIVASAVMSQPAVSDESSRPHDALHRVDVREVRTNYGHTSAESSSFDAELSWVMDGDSLRARSAGEQVEVRLADIDAPEHGQPYAWQAKLALIDLVRGKRLLVVPREVDRHGRIVARVWAGDIDLSRELVTRGAAWFYPAYAKDRTLRQNELRARAAKRGLWGVEGPRMAPWVWRHSHSSFQDHTPPLEQENQATKR